MQPTYRYKKQERYELTRWIKKTSQFCLDFMQNFYLPILNKSQALIRTLLNPIRPTFSYIILR